MEFSAHPAIGQGYWNWIQTSYWIIEVYFNVLKSVNFSGGYQIKQVINLVLYEVLWKLNKESFIMCNNSKANQE